MGSKALITSPDISSGQLYIKLPTFFHLYVWPFALFVYPYIGYVYQNKLYSEEVRYLTYIAVGTIHALFWLAGEWNTKVYCLMTCRKTDKVEQATHILVTPSKIGESSSVEPITKLVLPDSQTIQYSFSFQRKRFIYEPEKGCFANITFPMDEPSTIGTLKKSTGLTNIQSEIFLYRYGKNCFDIPIPTFGTLFKEHAVAPFFVFQIFCCVLWCLDDYWYFSLFSMFMIIALECSVVWQRQRTLTEFRTMSIKPYEIQVYRNKHWFPISTEDLLPNDVVSVLHNKEDSGLPCDLLLLSGSCVVNEAMLSGESTPLVKESIELRPEEAVIDVDELDKNAVLFGGTRVLQVTQSPFCKLKTPDNGVPAIVLRTGFETSQGSLVRTMVFSSEKVTANNRESLYFILFLLVFAIAASGYVWHVGSKTERSRYKLMLDCVMIITSVVPSELPMELSMAVNASLGALSKYYIYCTEPFRIPLSGHLDICCFDKTGTLTEEHMVVQGIAGVNRKDPYSLEKLSDASNDAILAIATAHTLVLLEQEGETPKVVGDPMEKATVENLGWSIEKKNFVSAPEGSVFYKGKVQIIRNFQFSSALKRQSSVSNVRVSGGSFKTFVSVKGAPEVIATMLREVPKDYEKIYKDYGRKGSRVLALGYKYFKNYIPENQVSDLSRESIESDLVFAGFLIFTSPLKEDARQTVQMLNNSSHRCMMITGDNPLTAVYVAEQVGIVEKPTLVLDIKHENEKILEWKSTDDTINLPMNPHKSLEASLYEKYDLCITGRALSQIINPDVIMSIFTHAWVYARVSPSQKEFMISTLKHNGYITLMCGDGTNDVGALKQAHVGVALLNASEEDMLEMQERARNQKLMGVYEKQIQLAKRFNLPTPPVPPALCHAFPPGPNNPHREKTQEGLNKVLEDLETKKASDVQLTEAEKAAERRANLANKMFDTLANASDDEAPKLKLGDASVAAPFTSKLAVVSSITNIVRQGRCTLVALVQMHKILALNCLITAYSLSVLHLDGIKFGDTQYTISGMLMSVCFYCVSRARPLETLSKERPQAGIFNTYIIGSVLGQFAIHIVTLIYITRVVYLYEDPLEKVDLEETFKPSLLNTAIYLLQLIQQVSTFAINYQGRPFREALSENKGMYYGLLGIAFVAIAGVTEFSPELNAKLQLVKMAYNFQIQLLATMVVDYAACWIIEELMKKYFRDNKPKEIVLRN
ncbi:Cation-transporting ATPase [Schizosaccharomyces pombe]|uniref:Endoplasmic reticulum transmembrane helix translocase n=1 Tax=Schizosaccharomyces pombe (strain 972 / ATCC 24843) TaxID=284812 RepID=ATC4_SCHPO|nr:P-type calcium transport ATPase Cta4 [Schizosaccharomyces pombe]O14072.1 RecName: Full=Endoplasmic reticulum transmembrane helix translocase; AltName: Full=P-type ATPase cta4; AltName: Full=P5A-type ATPase cta4; AltName: Full=Sporulation protein essential for vegetative growth 4 [Schizosaccharomyces pombe 972h-]CAA20137.1 P-type ATPase, calcium transporting Cta4 [Schizosaccharomyces pombe]|eukprot:NP_593971.1 P-type calcium transport ATPase Cta4 [Schizosaccharomyces pombe]